jgi:hypothetical protein
MYFRSFVDWQIYVGSRWEPFGWAIQGEVGITLDRCERLTHDSSSSCTHDTPLAVFQNSVSRRWPSGLLLLSGCSTMWGGGFSPAPNWTMMAATSHLEGPVSIHWLLQETPLPPWATQSPEKTHGSWDDHLSSFLIWSPAWAGSEHVCHRPIVRRGDVCCTAIFMQEPPKHHRRMKVPCPEVIAAVTSHVKTRPPMRAVVQLSTMVLTNSIASARRGRVISHSHQMCWVEPLKLGVRSSFCGNLPIVEKSDRDGRESLLFDILNLSVFIYPYRSITMSDSRTRV